MKNVEKIPDPLQWNLRLTGCIMETKMGNFKDKSRRDNVYAHSESGSIASVSMEMVSLLWTYQTGKI